MYELFAGLLFEGVYIRSLKVTVSSRDYQGIKLCPPFKLYIVSAIETKSEVLVCMLQGHDKDDRKRLESQS